MIQMIGIHVCTCQANLIPMLFKCTCVMSQIWERAAFVILTSSYNFQNSKAEIWGAGKKKTGEISTPEGQNIELLGF